MNFIFISPHFPSNHWKYCDRLHKDGVNVLGIGDMPYASLDPELTSVLTEYYRVDSMQDYDQMFRAIAFFSFKYGKIDWIESNNEYWLRQDARLRTDFNIKTGVQAADVSRFRSKSGMKQFYKKAGVPVPKHIIVSDRKAAEDFIREVGYPVIIKPDEGLGSRHTWKLENAKMLAHFFEELPEERYVMEEFVEGDICCYDAIIDSYGEPLFESETVWPPSIADIVNEQRDLSYCVMAEMPEKFREIGRATVEAFGVRSRFVHLEFFRLTEAKPGLGELGDYVGLEVNMRPAGGYTTDMMNYAHATDVYQIWADMIALDANVLSDPRHDHYCVYAGQRDRYNYLHSAQDIQAKFGRQIVMAEEMPEIMAPTMGNRMYTARFASFEEAESFVKYVQKKR